MLRIDTMNAEQVKRVKNIIDESNSFALLLDENAQEHALLARKALKAALQKKGKLVYLLVETPKKFKDKWSAVLPALANSPILHSNSIRIPKNQFNIKEISYEDEDDYLTLNITSESNGLNKESVVFDSKPTAIDAVFCFGMDLSKTDSLAKFEKKISLPRVDKIVSINQNSEAVAEKIHHIIRAIDETALSRDNISTILFASLLLERVSSYEQSREKTLELEQDLLRLGADKKFVSEIMMDFLSLEHLPII